MTNNLLSLSLWRVLTLQEDPELLRRELQTMLGAEYAEGATADPKMKAVISPHAGTSQFELLYSFDIYYHLLINIFFNQLNCTGAIEIDFGRTRLPALRFPIEIRAWVLRWPIKGRNDSDKLLTAKIAKT